jgi:hypothetical protein
MAQRWRPCGDNPENGRIREELLSGAAADNKVIPAQKCAVRHDQEIVINAARPDPPCPRRRVPSG